MDRKNSETPLPLGIHFLLEFYGCVYSEINSIYFIDNVVEKALSNVDVDVINKYFHKFEPQGVTGFFLLSASHISVHSWPESGYLACDVFTCDAYNSAETIVSVLRNNVQHTKLSIQKIFRGNNENASVGLPE
jgi:S-adenosylmethionine decarboxylase